MRVIAGSARRLLLKTIEGLETRPTQDRIKETLFNMINNDMYNCRFLDLFAGSGGIGIEALSRGAKEAVFVEKNPKACDCIRENLKTTHLQDKGTLLAGDVFDCLHRLESQKKVFDYIFMDPPYNHLLEKQVLELLAESSIIHSDTTIIVEASLETELDYLSDLGFELIKEKLYKTNKHVFITKGEQ